MKAKVSLVAIAVVVGGLASAAPSEPAAILDLFKRLPEPPATAAEAAKWYDKEGKLIQPALRSVLADLEAHKKSTKAMQESAQSKVSAQQTGDLSKTMAGFGVDMSRMNDPAYVKQVQDRMKQMSPQEMMAMSMKMAQPSMARPVQETPPVLAATEAGSAYQQKMQERLQTHSKTWSDVDEAVKKITAQGYPAQILAQKPRVESDCIGDDGSCVAQWTAYANKLLPLMVARDNEILQVRRTAYLRARDGMSGAVQVANTHLVATQYGSAAQGDQNKMMILGYDQLVVAELEQLIEKLEETVHRAAITTNCGITAVTEPITCR
jgi:hypothetical protein